MTKQLNGASGFWFAPLHWGTWSSWFRCALALKQGFASCFNSQAPQTLIVRSWFATALLKLARNAHFFLNSTTQNTIAWLKSTISIDVIQFFSLFFSRALLKAIVFSSDIHIALIIRMQSTLDDSNQYLLSKNLHSTPNQSSLACGKSKNKRSVSGFILIRNYQRQCKVFVFLF